MNNFSQQDFRKIEKILTEVSSDRIGINFNSIFGHISFNNDNIDLYIRYNDRYLTIARIAFSKQRQGIGTKILEEVKNIAKQKGVQWIIIESVSSQAMTNFCKKHGFERDPYNGMESSKGFWMGNYKLQINN